MAQHDYVIANGTGAAVRSDLNNALAAIVSQNSGATAPATTYAFQFWADTTTGLLKLRNSANSAWVTLFQLDGEWSTLPVENGTAAAPSIYFKDSGTDTGFYSPGTDQIGISTAGTSRLTIDANGNVAVDTNTLYVDAPNNRVGIGTGSPGSILTVQASGTQQALFSARANAGAGGGMTLQTDASDDGLFRLYDSAGAIKVQLDTDGGDNYIALGNVGIGTTSPGATLHLSTSGANCTQTIERTTGASFFVEAQTTNIALGASTSSALLLYTSNIERARIDSSGRLLVGTSSARSNFAGNASTPLVQIEGVTAATASSSVVRGAADATGPTFNLGKTRGASVGQHTVVVSGDQCGVITFQGADGTNLIRAAQIEAAVDGTPGANDMPGRLVFSTTADGASSPTERLRIANNGAWGLAGANYGSSGQVLTSNGSGSAPTWSTASGGITRATAVASTSGTSIDFTSIPSTVKKIIVMFKGVSTNGSSPIQVQLGTSSGPTTSGYGGSVQGPFDNGLGAATHSSGFRISNPNASGNVHEGIMTIANITGNDWVEGSLISWSSGGAAGFGSGSVSLSATLDRVRITTMNGTDTFDAGTLNIMYLS